MAKVRLNADGRVIDLTSKRGRAVPADVDWARVDRTSERTIARHKAQDQAAAAKDAAAYARRVRARTKLSQAAFAQRIGVPVDTVRNWEQGKRSPRGPARALLRVLDQAPDLAFSILDKGGR